MALVSTSSNFKKENLMVPPFILSANTQRGSFGVIYLVKDRTGQIPGGTPESFYSDNVLIFF